MAGLQHARIGASLEVASASLAGHRFEKHSHDEFVISANLCGLEDVWLDGRTFQADSGDLTLYNPGQIQGGGVRDGQPWRFASLYLPAAELASSLDLSSVEFDRPLLRSPALGRELAASIEALLASDRFARERGEERLLDFLGRLLAASGTRLPQRADPGRPAVARLQALLAERLAEPPDLDEMAEQVGLSKYHLLRAFKKATGSARASGACNCAPAAPSACCAVAWRWARWPTPWLRRPEPPDPLLHQRLRHFAGPLPARRARLNCAIRFKSASLPAGIIRRPTHGVVVPCSPSSSPPCCSVSPSMFPLARCSAKRCAAV
ncbi:transcriptional regulator [Pseudomonas aeruginosa VRFPA02]|nr:transcriptional regulator [Pseudomonas aeruginosa VRFPA02]